MIVDFYQLSASPIEKVLPRICERLLETGERLLVVAGAAHLDRLDAQLWTQGATSFLPHGPATGPAPGRQPILLSERVEPVNGARNIALADGRWRDEALRFDRVFHFFDVEGTGDARETWRVLTKEHDVECRYWRQESGKWVPGP